MQEQCQRSIYAKKLCRNHYDKKSYTLSPDKQLKRNKKYTAKTTSARLPGRSKDNNKISFNEDWLYF